MDPSFELFFRVVQETLKTLQTIIVFLDYLIEVKGKSLLKIFLYASDTGSCGP